MGWWVGGLIIIWGFVDDDFVDGMRWWSYRPDNHQFTRVTIQMLTCKLGQCSAEDKKIPL